MSLFGLCKSDLEQIPDGICGLVVQRKAGGEVPSQCCQVSLAFCVRDLRIDLVAKVVDRLDVRWVNEILDGSLEWAVEGVLRTDDCPR